MFRHPRKAWGVLLASNTDQQNSDPGQGEERTKSSAGASTSDRGAAPQLSVVDPVQTIAWGGKLPSARRAFLGGSTALAVALGGNFCGITGLLLGLDGGKVAASWGLDIIIPVQGHKRYVNYNDGYEFTYPAAWLADQTLYRRTARREESSHSLDPMDATDTGTSFGQRNIYPSTAFGPAASTGEENVSVIVGPIYQGFNLPSLGSPLEAGRRILDTIIAPEGSGKTADVVAAAARTDMFGTLYYSVEYVVRGAAFERHNCSVYTTRLAANGSPLLFTFNAQCPQAVWESERPLLIAAAASFALTTRTSPLEPKPRQRSSQRPPSPDDYLP